MEFGRFGVFCKKAKVVVSKLSVDSGADFWRVLLSFSKRRVSTSSSEIWGELNELQDSFKFLMSLSMIFFVIYYIFFVYIIFSPNFTFFHLMVRHPIHIQKKGPIEKHHWWGSSTGIFRFGKKFHYWCFRELKFPDQLFYRIFSDGCLWWHLSCLMHNMAHSTII